MGGCSDALPLPFAYYLFPVISSIYPLDPLPRDLPQCKLALWLRARRLRAPWKAKLEISSGVSVEPACRPYPEYENDLFVVRGPIVL